MDKATKLLNIEVENNIIKTQDIELKLTDGLGTVLYQKLKESKNRIFQIDGSTGEIDTYENYLQRCIVTAIAMRARGVKPGDIITVCSSNHFNTSVPIVASFFIGAIPANTDPNLPVSDTIHLLKLVRPKIIFVSANAVELIQNALNETGLKSEIVVFGETSKHTPFSSFLKGSDQEKHFETHQVSDLKEVVAIFFSSGTTGLSKGICLSHSAILIQVQQFSVNCAADAVILSSSLVYWISYTLTVLLSIFCNMSLLVFSKFESNIIWEIVEKHKVKMLVLSPTQIAILLQSPPPSDKDLSNLSLITLAGSALSKDQMMKLRSYVPNAVILCGYGSTEMGGIVLSFDASNEYDRHLIKMKPISCGRPLKNNTYKVVDLDTEIALGPNQQGEIRVKSKYHMNGYYNRDSSDEWDVDGFLKTGDIVYYDEDFCFYVVGRYKEMIKYQGWQITPVKLEDILQTHPAVKEAVVLGIPHPIDVEHPVALVVLKTEYEGNISPDELKKYYEEKVEDIHRLRGGLQFIQKVLKNTVGRGEKARDAYVVT